MMMRLKDHRRGEHTLVLTLFVILGSGCGQSSDTGASPEGSPAASVTVSPTDEPDPSASPPPEEPLSEDPPWGVDTVTLPDGAASMKVTFEAFPESLRGEDRLSLDFTQRALGSAYGSQAPPSTIIAIRVADYTRREAQTVGQFFSRFVSLDDALDEELDADPSDGLLWRSSRQAGGGRFREFVFGAPDSKWIFVVSADSPAMRESLVKTLVEVIREH